MQSFKNFIVETPEHVLDLVKRLVKHGTSSGRSDVSVDDIRLLQRTGKPDVDDPNAVSVNGQMFYVDLSKRTGPGVAYLGTDAEYLRTKQSWQHKKQLRMSAYSKIDKYLSHAEQEAIKVDKANRN